MGANRVGTPSVIPSGSGSSRPRWRTNTVLCAGLVGIRRSPSPSSRASATPSGFWARIASGPASMHEAALALGADHAAQARRAFEQTVGDAETSESMRGGEARDAPADDRDVDLTVCRPRP